MKRVLSHGLRLLLTASFVLGLMGSSTVLGQAASGEPTSTPASQPGSYYFPIKPGAPAQIPSKDTNLVASGVGQPPSDATAATGVDDRENTDGTGWAVYEHQTISQVLSTATNNNLRVVDLYVESTVSPYQLTAVYVSNSGSYAKSWWILVDVTPSSLLSFATTNNARIVVLKAFDDPAGSVKFYAILISNTGADAKGWWFYQGQTTSQLTALWQANNARITQINSYVKGGVTLYDAVMVDNTGANNRGWWWYVNATVGSLSTLLNNNNARLIDLDIDPATGNYNAIMTSCSGGCPHWWWWVGVTTANLLNVVLQDGARILDANVTPGCGDQCWSVVLINNSNAITTRVGDLLRNQTDGTLGLYLKQVGGPVLANLMDGTVFEPASAIKVVTDLYTFRQVQAGSVTLATAINKYIPPVGSSCPGNTVNGTEAINIADMEMMWHSDNTRTRELNDFFGTANVNTMANSLGLTHTAINHIVGCGGPIPDTTTLDDLGALYEGVANATFLNPAYRDLMFSHMAGKAEFKTEGYDWTHLWDTDLPAMIKQVAPPYAFQKDLNAYFSQMDLAYKAGNYNLCTTLACTTLIYDIAISGWAKIPFCDAGGPRQYVFGIYISNATSASNSSAAFNSAKSELLREQIQAGLASCLRAAMYVPTIRH
jgi:hypothetical protein